MARTTVDLDAEILRELKKRGREEGKSLGQLISELVAQSLAHNPQAKRPPPFTWTARAMGAQVDLEDKDAVNRALDSR